MSTFIYILKANCFMIILFTAKTVMVFKNILNLSEYFIASLSQFISIAILNYETWNYLHNFEFKQYNFISELSNPEY